MIRAGCSTQSEGLRYSRLTRISESIKKWQNEAERCKIDRHVTEEVRRGQLRGSAAQCHI